ncbi:hypothetical protein PINS_up023746 [Pythium insidiosum]|nr:hypothetical protein PINS_up023746 [Pythium insidiosum]
MAYSQGRFQDAVDVLLPIRGSLDLLGGTTIHQDLIELLLTESASRCEELQVAKLLLNERVTQRPQSAQSWKRVLACGRVARRRVRRARRPEHELRAWSRSGRQQTN